jgi:nucleotide-binding universal stress UspA family protein
MDLKSILVALDTSPMARGTARCAAAVAAAHEAHLIGLHVVDLPHVPRFVSVELPPEVEEIQRKRYQDAAEAARQSFEQACSAEGIEGEWRVVHGLTRMVIETHSRYSDLLCTSGPRADAGAGESTLSEELVLSVGKPVMVCPDGVEATVGKYVMVAWDGSREAARAVSDAMGILRRASKVSVVVVRDGSVPRGVGELPGADLCHYLSRHGVNAEAQVVDAEGDSVGATLMAWARGQGADLLVMGAYGHSRFREVLLGGVTRRMLLQAEIPLFMSH